jgi:putative tricarboxylic transport membrane protein
MVFITLPVANMALKFGPAEIFSLLIFALTATVTLSQGNMLKGFISLCLGFMICTIGIDPQTVCYAFYHGFGKFPGRH